MADPQRDKTLQPWLQTVRGRDDHAATASPTSLMSSLATLTNAHDAASSPPDPSRLAPEDAYYNSPRRPLAADAAISARKRRERARSSSRMRKSHYKKLLWFKQPCTFANRYSLRHFESLHSQFRTIIPTKRRSSTTCSAIRASSRMSSGHSWPTRLS